MGYAVLGVNSITCFRGSRNSDTMKDIKIVVKDKQDNVYFCKYSKAAFGRLPDDQVVQVFDEKGKPIKKFMRSFLTYVKDAENLGA
jgi:hypothetical protein